MHKLKSADIFNKKKCVVFSDLNVVFEQILSKHVT